MKYFPLIWAAISRKPIRTLLTFLSVIAAFLLLGLMFGLNASYAHIVDLSRRDRILIAPRFDGILTFAQREQIARLPGVTEVGSPGYIDGYFRDKKNRTFVIMMDDGLRREWKELPLTPAQWDQLWASRTGVFVSRLVAARFGLKQGDPYPVLTLTPSREDGSNLWPFTVLGVVDDIPNYQLGFSIGNYAYLDEARRDVNRGHVTNIQLLVKDPDQTAQIADDIDRLYANSATPTDSIPERFLYQSAFQAGIDIPFVTEAVAGSGLVMILFLTGNSIAQSVRERIPEFAVLKTLGFSDAGVVALVFMEAAIPCLLGAAIGLSLAKALAAVLQRLIPSAPGFTLPKPYMPLSLFVLGFGMALVVAFASAAIPALRIKRLDVATALARR